MNSEVPRHHKENNDQVVMSRMWIWERINPLMAASPDHTEGGDKLNRRTQAVPKFLFKFVHRCQNFSTYLREAC